MPSILAEISPATFTSQVLNAIQPVLVDFTAEWCPPCKMLDPIVHELADEYAGRLALVVVDADKNPAITSQYGIMGLPTLLLFKDGKVIQRIQGFLPKTALIHKLEQGLSLDNSTGQF